MASLPDAFSTDPQDSPFNSIRQERSDGTGFWSARDLMPLLGYLKWQKFEDSINRAKVSAGNQGYIVDDEFVQVAQLTGAGNLGDQERKDYELSRFAAYLVAMNGDPRKQQVSAAQAYFALQTRKSETQVDPFKNLSRGDLARMVIAEEEAKLKAQREHAVLVPKAAMFDAWQDSGDTVYVEEWGKQLGFTRQEAFEHLRALGVLSRRQRTDGYPGYLNLPNKPFDTLFEVRMEYVANIGVYAQVPRITPRGQILLAELLVKKGRLDPKALGYRPLASLRELEAGDTDE